jgi:hypothetical protein
MLLEWYDAGEDPQYVAPLEAQFFHVPTINQNSWAGTFTRCVRDPDPSNQRVAKANGNVALRCCVDGLQALENNVAGFFSLGMDNIPRAFLSCNLEGACYYTVCELAETDRLLQDKTREKEVPSGAERRNLYF